MTTWDVPAAPRLTMTAQLFDRVNLGCGDWPLAGWVNVDADPRVTPDVVADVRALPFPDESVGELYAGHLLEHLDEAGAAAFLRECRRVLVPNGALGIVVPDTRIVMREYLAGPGAQDLTMEYPQGQVHTIAGNLDAVCRLFLYSTVQDSHHQWSYDSDSLRALLDRHAFACVAPIDRFRDSRIPVGAWYQCGWDAVKVDACAF